MRCQDKLSRVSTVSSTPPTDIIDTESSRLSVGSDSKASQSVGDLDAYIKTLLAEPLSGEAAVILGDGGHTEASAHTGKRAA